MPVSVQCFSCIATTSRKAGCWWVFPGWGEAAAVPPHSTREWFSFMPDTALAVLGVLRGCLPSQVLACAVPGRLCSSALLFQKLHLKRGGTSSEYYSCLIESNTFEAAPEMSCALFKKGRVLLPSLNLTLLAYQIFFFFFPGMAGSCLKWKIDHSEQLKTGLHKSQLLFRYYNARQWGPWILAQKHLNIKA